MKTKYGSGRFCFKACSSSRAHSAETRKRISNSVSAAIESVHRSTRAGNAHHGWCGDIPYDSAFELSFILYNLYNKKDIKRCKEFFNYEFEGKQRRYFPDFVIDGQIYEVKGQFTEQDAAKLSQNPQVKLVPLSFIHDTMRFCERRYGKKFWELFQDKDSGSNVIVKSED